MTFLCRNLRIELMRRQRDINHRNRVICGQSNFGMPRAHRLFKAQSGQGAFKPEAVDFDPILCHVIGIRGQNMNSKSDLQKRFNEVFPKGLNETQYEGFARILDRAIKGASEAPIKQAAYILATAYWESALTFHPVREGLAQTDEAARQYVAKLFEEGKIRTNYALPAANGQSFYGRGFVQLTWERNYRRIGDHLIGDEEIFYNDPDQVLRTDLAAIILVRGMVDGIFSEEGQRLNDFINRDRADYLHARQTVNRMDRAETIANWAEKMEYAIGGVRYI